MIPSYCRKAICGQTNYLDMVTTHRMNENEMGYRGSKSEILNIPIPNRISVKEQRVDGSYCTYKKNLQLRCTLMGFERYYQTSIPSKQLNIRTFSTSSLKPKLNPWFVTGIIDAEGTFCTTIYKKKSLQNWMGCKIFF